MDEQYYSEVGNGEGEEDDDYEDYDTEEERTIDLFLDQGGINHESLGGMNQIQNQAHAHAQAAAEWQQSHV